MTETEILAEIATLETSAAATAGVSSTSFGDQSISFDRGGLESRLAYLRRLLLSTQGTPRNIRYASTSKGV